MRQIGTLSSELHVRRFSDFLLTKGVRSQADPVPDGWAIWVYDEDRVSEARTLLAGFQQNPDEPLYLQAERDAEKLRAEAIQREKQIRRNVVDVRSQWTNANPAKRPLTFLLIAASIAVGFMTNFGDEDWDSPTMSKLSFAGFQPSKLSGYVAYNDPFGPHSDFLKGEVWRLVTPAFLHFGPLHLLFNMMCMHSLGSVIEIRRGSIRFALLFLFLAATSSTAQYLWSGPTFGGMSGVVFGLFGYVWIKSRYDPSAGMSIDRANVIMMLFWLILCMTGLVGRIANAAHLVGLIGGMGAAFAPVAWRRLVGR